MSLMRILSAALHDTNQIEWRLEPIDDKPLATSDAAKRWTSLELAIEWAEDLFRKEGRMVEIARI